MSNFGRVLMLAKGFWFLSLVLGISLNAAISSAYTLPKASPKPETDERLIELQKISKGVAAISKEASRAVVLVSVAKTVRGLPMGMIDPFDFFFGTPNRRGPGQVPQQRQEGLGSGFIVDLDKGYILTNNHVVEGADEISLKFANGETHEGKVVGRDQKTDVAVVEVKDKNFKKKNLAALPLGNSTEASVGDFVIAIGAPFKLEASISFGVVSALGRGNLDITQIGDFIQTDAAINPGNSGGPLLNMQGQVIGINTAIYSRSGGYNGIGFAIPINLAKTVAEELINGGGKLDRGYLGVGLQRLDSDLKQGLSLPEDLNGALIAEVVPGGPADRAGVKAGDVVVGVDGKAVESSSDLQNVIGLAKPGKSIKLEIFRDGDKKNVTVKIAPWPGRGEQVAGERGDEGDDSAKAMPFGLNVSNITPELRRQYRFESKQGVVVMGIAPQSAADRSGLEIGDVIVAVNGKKITNTKDFGSYKKSGKKLLLRIERASNYFFVPLRGE